MSEVKLHWTRKRLLERIEKRGGVMCENRDGERHYAYLDNGREIGRSGVEALIGHGLLIAQNDGLFGESQTYRAKA